MMIDIHTLRELIEARNNPYRSSEYLFDGTQVFTVSDDDNENEALIESYGEEGLAYGINWEDYDLYTEEGVKIESMYDTRIT